MNIKKENGITLFILVLTIVIMAMLIGTVTVNISSYLDIKSLKNLAGDLQNLREKVDIYYEKFNVLPIKKKVTTDVPSRLGDDRNSNDNEVYYEIDTDLLDGLSLTYGHGDFVDDYFIINEDTHNIYYYAGIIANKQLYYGIKDIPPTIAQNYFGIEPFELKTKTDTVISDSIIDVQLEVYADVQDEDIAGYRFKLNNGEWTSRQDSASYTFHNLNQHETYTVSMLIIDKDENEIYATNNGTAVTIEQLTINATIDGNPIGAYNNPVIPAGFSAIDVDNAVWGSSDGYKNGLVIKDKVGNEFVWVPVDGLNVVFERSNWYDEDGRTSLGNTVEECSETLPSELTASVAYYGGFYIARYEAGKRSANGVDTLVSMVNIPVWDNINWTEANTKASNMYENEDSKVTSTLIYGAQWDTTLKFMSAYNVGEDNYEKNIYGMADNVLEWTAEKNNANGIRRGTTSANNVAVEKAAAYRNSSAVNYSSSDTGFRVALFINK